MALHLHLHSVNHPSPAPAERIRVSIKCVEHSTRGSARLSTMPHARVQSTKELVAGSSPLDLKTSMQLQLGVENLKNSSVTPNLSLKSSGKPPKYKVVKRAAPEPDYEISPGDTEMGAAITKSPADDLNLKSGPPARKLQRLKKFRK